MSLLPFFEWCYQTQIGETIRNSVWLFPVLEAFHLLGLGFAASAILLVDLRLLGAGLSRQPVPQLAANARPILIGSLIVMFGSGIPLFMSEATKCYYSFAFWAKMAFLVLALLFASTIRRRVIHSNLDLSQPMVSQIVGGISLGLWFGVAWGGRWIGFS